MRNLIALILLFLSLLGCADAPRQALGQGNVLLVLGDSLSAGYGLASEDDGWVAKMTQSMRADGFLTGTQEVVNASVSGETSAGGLERLQDLLDEHNPEVVVIELGANDALRRQPMATLSQNLTTMIRMVRQDGGKVVLVGMDIPGLAGLMGGGKLEDTIEEVADKTDTPLISFPLSDLMDGGMMQEDRLHPNAAGQPLIQETLEPVIRQVMSQP